MKKNSKIIVALTLSVLMLSFAAFAGVNQNAGYETFKEIMKNKEMHEMSDKAMSGSIKIVDNGVTVVDMTGEFVKDEAKEEVSGRVNLVTETVDKNLMIYGLGDAIYVEDLEANEVYKGIKSEDYDGSKKSHSLKSKNWNVNTKLDNFLKV